MKSDRRPRIVGITGGIGSGKSVVSEMLRTMGFRVYDCDFEAKRLMDESDEIKSEIVADVCREAVDADGRIDRKRLSREVFSDPGKLERLNHIVHHHVAMDMLRWAGMASDSTVFVESAILYSSGFDKMMDNVIEIVAPEDVRIERVMKRNQMDRSEVAARIRSQERESVGRNGSPLRIHNDGNSAVLPQLLDFLSELESDC